MPLVKAKGYFFGTKWRVATNSGDTPAGSVSGRK